MTEFIFIVIPLAVGWAILIVVPAVILFLLLTKLWKKL